MIRYLLVAIVTIAITSCSLFKPYHMDIQQGNELTATQISKIHTGMSKNDVIDTLGSPIQSSALDSNRYDYTYTMQENGGPIEVKRLSLYFKNNKLSNIEKSQDTLSK